MRSEIGRRERNKELKLGRIRHAAWELFRAQGYDAATTRAVAEKADVAVGTVFLYAPQKRDLLFLAFEEVFATTLENALKEPRRGGLVHQLDRLFGHFLDFYAEHGELGRAFVRELQFSGEASIRKPAIDALTAKYVEEIARRIGAALGREELAPDVKPLELATVFFSLYFAAVTGLLGGTFDRRAAGHWLSRALELVIHGAGRETKR